VARHSESHFQLCHACKKFVYAAAAACIFCGTPLPAEAAAQAQSAGACVVKVLHTRGNAPLYTPLSRQRPVAELADDQSHDHREYDPDPVRGAEYTAGGGTVSAGATLSGGGMLTAGGTVEPGASMLGVGTLSAGGAVPTMTVLSGTGTLSAG
jgi:hypothetical protein